MKHIFISYQHSQDRDFADNMSHTLEKAGFTIWIDHHIPAGEEWRNHIDQAIKDAFAIIVVMSPEAKVSEYVTYEWAYAWGLGIRIIPIMLKKTSLHPRLEAFQFLDFTNSVRPWEKLIAEVKEAVKATSLPLTTTAKADIPSFIQQVQIALNNTNAIVRENAITTLAQADSSEAQEMLLKTLSHPIADVREHAAKALGKMRNRKAVPKLTELLRDSDFSVRQETVQALGIIGDKSAIASLLEALETARIEERINIVQTLSWFGDESVIPALLDLYEKDTALGLRSTIIGALGMVYSLGHLEKAPFIPTLEKALYQNEKTLPESASRILLDIGSVEALNVLTKALLSLPQAQCKVLAETISQLNVHGLIANLSDTYHQNIDKRRIIWIFRILKNGSAVPTLIQAVNDKDGIVQQEAVFALKVIGDERALPVLLGILMQIPHISNEKTSIFAIQAIGQLGNSSVLPRLRFTLEGILRNHSPELIVYMIYALGKLGDYETIDYLRNFRSSITKDGFRSHPVKKEIYDAIDQAIKEIRSKLQL